MLGTTHTTHNKGRKRLRVDKKNLGERYDLDDTIFCNSICPSSFGTPMFLYGAQEPALCFVPSCPKCLKNMYVTIDFSTGSLSEPNSWSPKGYATRTGGESQLILGKSDQNIEQYLPQSMKSVNDEVAKKPSAFENYCGEAFSVSKSRPVERQAQSETPNIGLHKIGKDSLISLVKERIEGIFDAIQTGKMKFKYSKDFPRPSSLKLPSVFSSNDINDDQLLFCDEFEGAAMSQLTFSSVRDDFPLLTMQETEILRSLSVIVRSTALQLARSGNKLEN